MKSTPGNIILSIAGFVGGVLFLLFCACIIYKYKRWISKSVHSLWTRIENLRDIWRKERKSSSYQNQTTGQNLEMYQQLLGHFRKGGDPPILQSPAKSAKMQTAIGFSQIIEKDDISDTSPIVLHCEDSNIIH